MLLHGVANKKTPTPCDIGAFVGFFMPVSLAL